MKLSKIITIIALVLIGNFASAQGDLCTTATPIGSLPAPGACSSGLQDGAVVVTGGTTVGSTADNPYVYQTGCQGSGGQMDAPANDVWYSFIATGSVLNISISGLSNANIGLWSGACGSLAGGGCLTTPGSGNGTATVTQLIIGNTYFISVSSQDDTGGNDGAFSLSLDNDIDCNDCLRQSSITASPLPTNGGYDAGQVVTFCYTVTDFVETNSNWFHGVQITMGAGWTGVISGAVPDVGCGFNPPGAGNPSIGEWEFFSSATSSATGNVFGQGFYWDSGTTPDGNPGNNFGDPNSGSCSWTFCWDLTVGPCTSGMDLGVTINTTGDGESGSWTSVACGDDDATNFLAVGVCCPNPIIDSTDVCGTACNGTVTANGIGATGAGIGPWDYVWENSSNVIISTANNVNGPNTVTGLCAGTYDVTITDATSCVVTGSVTINSITIPNADSPSNVGVCAGYILPALTVGNYFTTTGGVGPIAVGTNITITQTIFVYAETGTTPNNCTDENSFIVTITNAPTTSNAGFDQTVCATTDIIAANTPTLGSGVWTLISGSGTISNPNSPITVVNGLGTGANVFQWTISNAPCPPSTSQVTITSVTPPTTANAGTNQTVCATTATLAGNTATVGNGVWTLISGSGTITTPTSPTSGITGLGTGANVFQWTITTSAPCTPSTSQVTITGVAAPSTANAGTNQTVCTTTATLAGNTATIGSGLWTLISGSGIITTPTSPTSGITGLGTGANVFQWTITTSAPCPLSTSQVTISGVPAPTTANAGTNQTVCATTATLAGNTATIGTGVWTLISGSGTITTPASPTSGITGLGTGANVFQWTITTSAPCTPSMSQVTITGVAAPTSANAGANQSVCATTATLAGNTATVGSGVWTLISGSGTITTPTSPTSGITGLGTGANVFQWTITTSAPCPPSTSQVTITSNSLPTVSPVSASACENVSGSGQALNVNVTGLETGLNGTGTFVWYDDNGYITVSAPQPTNVTVNNGQTFYFEVTLNGCSVQDSITYTVTGNITLTDPNPQFCEDPLGSGLVTGINLTTLNSSVFSGAATFTWATGPAGVTINDNDIINVQVTAAGCPSVNINVNFDVNPLPTSNPASINLCEVVLGGGQATFDLTSLNSTVNGGTASAVAWFTSFANIPSTPIVGANTFLSGSTTVFAQVTDATTNCTDTAVITLTVIPAAIAGADNTQTLCSTNGNTTDLNSLLVGNTIIGAWAETSVIPSSQFTAVTGILDVSGLTAGNYTFIYFVTGASPCPNDTANFTVTVNSLPVAIDQTPQLCEVGAGSGSAPGVDLTQNESNIDGGAGNTMTWFAALPPLSPVGTPTSTTINNGDIFYVLVDNGNCTDTATVTYSVTATIALNNPNDSLCEDVAGGGSVAGIDLTSYNTSIYTGVAPTYNWFTDAAMTAPNEITGASLTSFTITNGTADTFYVDVTDGTCNNNIMVIFTVNALPISNPDAIAICDDGTGQATFDLTSLDNAVNGVTSNAVVWFANFADIALNSPIGTPNTYVSGSTTVFAQVTGPNSTNCTDTAAITLTVNPLPITNTSSISLCDDGSGQATFDLTTLDNIVNGGVINSVAWFANFADIALNNPIATPIAFISGATTVFAQVTDATTFCNDTVSTTLTVDPQLTINTISDTALCIDATVILTAIASGNGIVNWYSDVNGTTIINTGNTFTVPSSSVGTTTYYVNELGTCPSPMESFIVTVEEAIAIINATPITGDIPLDVFFGSGSTTGANYIWDFGEGNGSTSFEPSNTYKNIGLYTVTLTVTSTTGCSASATIEIEAIGGSAILIPNVFTPNGDNENDIFTVDGVNLESVEGEIFNRWGQKMFAWNNVKGHWDGRTLSGSQAPEGTYFYIISAIGFDGEKYFKKGTVSLIR